MSAMVIKRGYKGEPVEKWQTFLRGLGFVLVVDGDFGPKTEAATIEFQKRNGVTPADGVVGNCTLGAAMAMGYEVLPTGQIEARNYPEKPEGLRPITHAERGAKFGSFKFEPAPSADFPEAIRITERSPEYRIALVHLPQLVGVKGFPTSGRVLFHAAAADSLVKLVEAWKKAGLLHHILTWGGAYFPRYVRGSRTTLSNHSWGTAFDINAAWNGLGRMPAKAGETGSVRELVELAVEHGYFWGGWWGKGKPDEAGRLRGCDGMHFEAL